ncbi:hypothetical protein C4D60_Mb06t09680 [Musa balbisiana]|uniref:Uncharacterized protein n=1 Tax=Musa balbisiana TaxID=52838 RepID=A0A4S8IML3_MUSBA|nr:hypothetical protein C4D60_Mb06t09680 [Musa balbisiana]
MAARLTRLLSPLRGSCRIDAVLSPSRPSLLLFSSRSSVPGRYGLLKNWGKSWIQPASPSRSVPPFEFTKRRILSQGLNLSGKKLTGSVLGFMIVNGMISHHSRTAYALDDSADEQEDFGVRAGYLKDELHTFWVLVRKFQLPAVLVITVLLGWRHPLTLAINVALLLFSTRPNPFSVYMFIEQVFHRKNVKVEDYKFLCLATVEQGDTKLNLLGILVVDQIQRVGASRPQGIIEAPTNLIDASNCQNFVPHDPIRVVEERLVAFTCQKPVRIANI